MASKVSNASRSPTMRCRFPRACVTPRFIARWRRGGSRAGGGSGAGPRVGIGGAEGPPRRIAQAEAVLAGSKPGDEVFRAAAEAAAEAIEPIEDAQADAAFRLDLVRAAPQLPLERARA